MCKSASSSVVNDEQMLHVEIENQVEYLSADGPSGVYMFAPISSAYFCVTGAPPIMTLTVSRTPASLSASIEALTDSFVCCKTMLPQQWATFFQPADRAEFVLTARRP